MMTDINSQIVFYDDACPLCNAEIEHYKKITPIQEITWLGIESAWDDVQHYGLDKSTLLRRIHGVNKDGKIISGAAVFVMIWESLSYYRWLGTLVAKCRLVPVLDFFYKYFAAWRYKKNQCSSDQCSS